MNPIINLRVISLCLSFIILISGCKPNADKIITEGLELYGSGKTEEARQYLGKGLIYSVLLKKSDEANLLFGENVIFRRQKNSIRTIWPMDMNIDIENNYTIISHDTDSGKIGLSNGSDLKIYNSEGALIKTYGPPDENRILAFSLIHENIIYYKNNNIYFYDSSSGSERAMTDGKKFTPASNGTIDIKFYRDGDQLAVSSGIAGKYSIIVFDLNNNSVIFNITNAASSKILLQNSEIYFISGNAGKYSISKSAIPDGKQKDIITFENIIDIGLFSSGAIFENKDGFWITDYNTGNEQKIPFKYQLSGQCSGSPVIKYSDAFYIIDFKGFMDRFDGIKQKIPSFFENKKNRL
jgi:hypothetical protein